MKNWRDVEGWFKHTEVIKIQELAKGKVCVEVGSFKGKSTCALLEVAKMVHAVDYFRSKPNGQCQALEYTTLDEFKENTAGGNVKIWTCASPHACRNIDKDSVDLVFIDGLHTYEAVLSDIICWWERLKIGGYFCFHDSNVAGVKRAINEVFGKPEGLVNSLSYVKKTFPDIWNRK